MFLPRSEDDDHSPESFEATMQACVPIADRDPKQRVFRATAPLGRWIATGGHTVIGSDDVVAPVRLRLRHYFGLSLDHIRCEYLSRVFSRKDLAKLWHGPRRGARYDVVPPDPGLLRDITRTEEADTPLTSAPVFRPRDVPVARAVARGRTDLQIVAFSKEVGNRTKAVLSETFPGLRMAVSQDRSGGTVPVLQVLEHPAASFHGGVRDQVAHAERWLRHVASARQNAFLSASRYAEIRAEDVDATAGLLDSAVHLLVAGSGERVALVDGRSRRTVDAYTGRLKRITLPMARDLGYE